MGIEDIAIVHRQVWLRVYCLWLASSIFS